MFKFIKRLFKKRSSKQILKDDEEIRECVEHLCEHFTLISARFQGDHESYMTSIIGHDFERQTLTIDEFIPKGGNRCLLEKGFVHLFTRLDGTRYSFECKLITATQEDDLPCFVVSYPRQVESIQRRHCYRVVLPKAQSYTLHVRLFDGTLVRAVLNDISVSGLSFRCDSSRRSGLTAGDAVGISGLGLYESELSCKADIRRVNKLPKGHLIAVQFTDIERGQEAIIEQFVAQMQREKQAE